MRLGLLEGALICFTALLVFGTKRLHKIKASFKKAADEFKEGMGKDE